jgi:Flp pilus assembly protein TadG
VSTHGRRGQALVEFVLVLPLLCLLLLGMLDYGLYLNANLTIEEAARIGARAGAIGDPEGCPGDSAAQELAQGQPVTIYGVVDDQINQGFGLHAQGAVLTPAPTETANATDPQAGDITVSVSLPYHPLVAFPGLLPSTVTLMQAYTMMVEVPEPTNSNGTLQQSCP